MTTLSLFDSIASEQARDEAVTAVEIHHAAWVKSALLAVYQVAVRQQTLTTDDVWKVIIEKPREGRAMGAVMVKARKMHWIEPTSQFVATEKVSQHRQPIRKWRSLVWREAA